MGHAIYTKSDPRALILKHAARPLAEQTGYVKELDLLESIERLVPDVFARVTGSDKTMCANVDFYSRLGLYHAEYPPGGIHASVCHCTCGRLVRPPD